jgi:cephalosporin hydroxylase
MPVSLLSQYGLTREVIGLDIDIRAHDRAAIEADPTANRVNMIEGSSVDPEIIARVRTLSDGYRRILVCLDSNHTHAHVLAELEAYAPLVAPASHCVVFDRAL